MLDEVRTKHHFEIVWLIERKAHICGAEGLQAFDGVIRRSAKCRRLGFVKPPKPLFRDCRQQCRFVCKVMVWRRLRDTGSPGRFSQAEGGDAPFGGQLGRSVDECLTQRAVVIRFRRLGNLCHLVIVKISIKDILTMLSSMLSPQQLLTRGALVFLASALFHAVVWLLDGMPSLEGPVSWRKPMTFGVSTGVLFLSLAWIVSLLPQTRRLRRQAVAFTGLLIAEIALIDMQQWRGVASHFNTTTPFDSAVFTAMGALILAASVIIAWWTWDLFRHSLPTTAAFGFAARAGMVMLNVGNLIGVTMAATHSNDLKPLHGVALHVIQALPIAIWAAMRVGYPRTWRDRLSVPHLLSSSPDWRHR